MSVTFDAIAQLESLTCSQCGILFAMPQHFVKHRRWDHETFYCPAGHSQYFPAKNEAEKLRDELTRERARLDQEKAEVERLRRSVADRDRQVALRDRQVAARKAVATKLRKRIAAGKCPCCHAKFKDLSHHMTTKHPDWNPERAAEALAAKDAR